MNVEYGKIDPEQIKDTYGEYDVVDFMINTDRNIVSGSIRLEGDIEFQTAGARIDHTNSIYYNPHTGIHGVCESISTQLGGSGEVVEFIQNYGRYCNMKNAVNKDDDDYFNSRDVCELMVSSAEQAKQICRGKVHQNSDNTIEDGDFSFVPQFCLNRVSNGSSVSLAPYNNLVKVSVNLARNFSFLTGAGVVATSQYLLKNLKMTFRTVPSSPTPNLMCRSFVSLKQTISTNNASVNTRVPAIAEGVSVSFLQQQKENTGIDNNYQLEKPPQPKSVKYMFNDNSSNYITYSITDIGEMVQGGIESMNGGKHNSVNPTKQGGVNGWVMGANFNGAIDLRSQKFTMELESSISTIPYLVFMFFHTRINLGNAPQQLN